MKKVFTLLLSLGAMTAVFAQRGHDRDQSRDVILGQQNRTIYDNDRRGDYGNYNDRDKQEQIQRIYREYNWKIESVRRDRYLRNSEKKREIRSLENERDSKIRYINDRYNRSYRSNGRRY
jgi:hypothetical protein